LILQHPSRAIFVFQKDLFFKRARLDLLRKWFSVTLRSVRCINLFLGKRRSKNEKEEMATPETPAPVQTPGFIAVLFDVPFPISIPNGSYISHDPKKGIAAVTSTRIFHWRA
jgi:hypothetical protein